MLKEKNTIKIHVTSSVFEVWFLSEKYFIMLDLLF